MIRKAWTHKVVKTQRGGQGEWFRYRAATTGSERDCRRYARDFAEEQRDIGGTRILVLTRGGRYVAEYRVAS